MIAVNFSPSGLLSDDSEFLREVYLPQDKIVHTNHKTIWLLKVGEGAGPKI